MFIYLKKNKCLKLNVHSFCHQLNIIAVTMLRHIAAVLRLSQ